MLAGHRAVREDLGEAFTHDLGGRGLARLHRVDGLGHGRDLRALRFGDRGNDVAVEVHGAALVFGLREHLGDRADHAGGLVAGERANAAQPARFQPRQEIALALGRLGEALGAPDHLAIAVLVHADGDHDGDVLVGAAPAALQVDAVDVDVRVFASQRPAPPLVDRFERLVVEIGDRAGGNARAPQDLADVLDAPRRHAGQVHLDDGLLDRRLAPFVALNDRRGEAHALELGHLERDLARRRGEPALVVPGADGSVSRLVEWCDWIGYGVISSMIERVAQVMPTACAMSFLTAFFDTWWTQDVVTCHLAQLTCLRI